MIESILANSGIECGVIGTINYRYKDKFIDANNTTPQSPDIYRIMREMADSNIKYLVMEVSSHALSLDRVSVIDFDTAVFTNLSHDHLDFHRDLNSYFKAKSILFKKLGTYTKKNEKYAIINADDTYGKKLSETKINGEIKLYSALGKKSADFKAEDIEITSKSSTFNLFFNNEEAKITIKHIGLHNVYNALAAFAAAICSGISFRKAVEGLTSARQVPGRLEKIDTKGLGFEIVVDYAHTDGALKEVLETLKKIKPSRIITVFGCGGNRDRTKRPSMGKVAVEMSDFVFLTSDNPRTEDLYQIILDIETGIRKIDKRNYKIVLDRETAIK
jgi:UDP-N-acetylmuramoyl-L-alanyl-D-glutamate--2,6-diaminopimelate ligase